jgi:hypothetical protein
MSKNLTQSWLALDVQESNRTAKRLHNARIKFSLACGSLMTGLAATVVLDAQEQAMTAANITFGTSIALGATATGLYLAKTFSLDHAHTEQEKAITAYVDRVIPGLEKQMDEIGEIPPESTSEDWE